MNKNLSKHLKYYFRIYILVDGKHTHKLKIYILIIMRNVIIKNT